MSQAKRKQELLMSAITRDEIAYESAPGASKTVAFKAKAKSTWLGANGQMLGVAILLFAIAAAGFLAAVASQKYALEDDPAAPPAFTAVGP
jgi:hypothetical protein